MCSVDVGLSAVVVLTVFVVVAGVPLSVAVAGQRMHMALVRLRRMLAMSDACCEDEAIKREKGMVFAEPSGNKLRHKVQLSQ